MQHSRRSFLQTALAGPALFAAAPALSKPTPVADARAYWVGLTEKIAGPVLENLAARTLKKNMPVEAANPKAREPFTHLEAFGRLLCGIAPWLETDQPEKWLALTRESIDAGTDPASPDCFNFTKPAQPLVDAAFLAQGLLRAPNALWKPLDARVKSNVIAALKKTRAIKPYANNWLLFAAIVEAFLKTVGEEIVRPRVGEAIRKHNEWYKGDGVYGDGPRFHWDYYNGYVIHPMLVDLALVFGNDPEWKEPLKDVMKRATRYAAIQERLISPEGTYPVLGRSMAYRFGAFQPLAQMALLKKLPGGVSPAQVRCAMTALIRRQMEAPGTFDEKGWLTLGFCGHQPKIADGYVSTGSLYLCAAGLLALGLPAADPFWSAPDEPWTAAKAWSGVNIPGDHAL